MNKSVKKASKSDTRLGGIIRGLREKRGLTQIEVSNRIGVSFQQLQKYESGKNRLTVTRLISISDALNVSPAAIIGKLRTASPRKVA